MIEIKRGKNRNHIILKDGNPIGESWKVPRASGFGVRLKGIYWRGGEPNRSGGLSRVSVKRLKDVPSFVEETLTKLGD